MRKMVEKIDEWAYNRRLYSKSHSLLQMAYLHNEIAKLDEEVTHHALMRGDRNKLQVSIGACVFVLIILSIMHGLDLEFCLDLAYKEIKDKPLRWLRRKI